MNKVDPVSLAKLQMRLAALMRGVAGGKDDRWTVKYEKESEELTVVRESTIGKDLQTKTVRVSIWELIALAQVGRIDLKAAQGHPQSLDALNRLRKEMSDLGWLVPGEEPGKDKPRRRRSGGGHDRVAAQIRGGKLNSLHQKVMGAFEHAGDYGLTDFELNADLGGDGGSTWRTRRAELVAGGKIIDSHESRRVGDRLRTIWKLARYADGAKDSHPNEAAQ